MIFGKREINIPPRPFQHLNLSPEQIERETTQALDDLYEKNARQPDGVSVSFRDLCSSWPWARRSDVFTHLIHPYPAKVLAYIPIFFLSTERYATRDNAIMDIFSGSSTILLESITHPVFPRNAYGIEINPIARLISKVKTTLINIDQTATAAALVIKKAGKVKRVKVPEYDFLDYWFAPKMQQSLGHIAWAIDHVETDDDIRDFLLVCLSSIVKKCSYADPDIPVPVHLNLKENKRKKTKVEKRNRIVKKILDDLEKIDPIEEFSKTIENNLTRMRLFTLAMDGRTVKASLICPDARKIQNIPLGPRAKFCIGQATPFADNSIPLVITSPPYGSAQKYVRATRLEMLWTGLATSRDITGLDKQTVGTESVSCAERDQIVQTGYPEIDGLVRRLAEKSTERAAITATYFSEMVKVLQETRRVLIPGGKLILIIGDNEACDQNIPNHQYLKIIAENLGFSQELLLKDHVRSRGMMTKRHKTAGMIDDDWVVILEKIPRN